MKDFARIMPCLLLRGNGLVKGRRFKHHTYVGDPINAVKIFNDKEVDELVFLDISASSEKRPPNIELIRQLADECYMPFAVGGGISDVRQIEHILKAGAEKVVINTAAIRNPQLIAEAAKTFGSQSVVVSVDVKKNIFGKYKLMSHSGRKKEKNDPLEWAQQAAALGAGEILLNSIDRDGMMHGYDLELLKLFSDQLNIPLIAAGGAGKLADFHDALESGSSALAAGSFFVFTGKYRAVLINYPDKKQLENLG